MRIPGYFSKPKLVCERQGLGNTAAAATTASTLTKEVTHSVTPLKSSSLEGYYVGVKQWEYYSLNDNL